MSPRDASNDFRAWNPRSRTERRLHASDLGIELIISRIEAKFKLSQPRPEADLTGVIDGHGARGDTATAARRFELTTPARWRSSVAPDTDARVQRRTRALANRQRLRVVGCRSKPVEAGSCVATFGPRDADTLGPSDHRSGKRRCARKACPAQDHRLSSPDHLTCGACACQDVDRKCVAMLKGDQ